MHTQHRHSLCIWVGILFTLGLLIMIPPGRAQLQEDSAQQFYNLINKTRASEGLPPLKWSKLLNQAAQRQAEDMATQGKATSDGSDGTDHRQRIREAGYRAWHDGLLVSELVWMGLGSPSDALTWFRNNPEHWEVFTSPKYREIGIGYASDAQGVHYFAIDFGSRPGVIPVFLNDGAEATDSPQVALRLTNEQAEPLGEGTWIGEAIEVRLSSQPDFGDTPWQPWESLLPWLLDGTEPGEYAVYVEYRDGAGRTAVAEDTIRLVAQGETPPTPTPRIEEPLQPTAEGPAIPGTAESTEVPATPQPTMPPVVVTQEPVADTFMSTPQPTWTPLPVPVETIPVEATDWPLVVVFILQGSALVLGIAVFLRRRL